MAREGIRHQKFEKFPKKTGPKKRAGFQKPECENELFFYMTFAASDRSFFGLDVAALALFVIGHHQARLGALRFKRVTVGAGLVLGAFALDEFSIRIDMMANGAVFQGSLFVVNVMIECAYRTLQRSKSVNLQVGIFLGKSRNTAKRDAEHDRAENEVSV